MRYFGFVLCLFCSALSASPDSTTVRVTTVTEVPVAFLKLRLSNDSIANNDRLNEELVDMVQVDERDRKVPTLYTTHQSYGFGWFTRMIGFYWHPVDRMRYKFVGTNRNGLNMPGEKDELTEHDVNFNLIPHLSQYQQFVYRGRTAQTKRYQFRRDKHADISKPPFIPPTLQTADVYELHCELTPPKKMRDSVNVQFYPCMHGCNLDRHPNFYDMKPTIGLYGVFVLDCNHACHPEIHPYEWLWWIKTTAEDRANSSFNKNWMLGFFKESSNRFILWSRPPRVGTISIPFIFNTSETASYLKLNHIVTGKFKPKGIAKIKDRIPSNTREFNFSDTLIKLQLSENKSFPLHLATNKIIATSALQWWFSDIHTDVENNWVWGYFNIVVSVKDGYTARLESLAK